MRLSPQALLANLGAIQTGLQQGKMLGQAQKLEREQQQANLDFQRQRLDQDQTGYLHGLEREKVLDSRYDQDRVQENQRYQQGRELEGAKAYGAYADPGVLARVYEHIMGGGHLGDAAPVPQSPVSQFQFGPSGVSAPILPPVKTGTYGEAVRATAGETDAQQKARFDQGAAEIKSRDAQALEDRRQKGRLLLAQLRAQAVTGDKRAARVLQAAIAGLNQGFTTLEDINLFVNQYADPGDSENPEATAPPNTSLALPLGGAEGPMLGPDTPQRSAGPAGFSAPTKASAGVANTQADTTLKGAQAGLASARMSAIPEEIRIKQEQAAAATLRAKNDVAQLGELRRYHGLQDRWHNSSLKLQATLANNRLSFDQKKEAFNQALEGQKLVLDSVAKGKSGAFSENQRAYAQELLDQMKQITQGMKELRVKSATGTLTKAQRAGIDQQLQEFQGQYDVIRDSWQKEVQGEGILKPSSATPSTGPIITPPTPTVTADPAVRNLARKANPEKTIQILMRKYHLTRPQAEAKVSGAFQ